MDYAFTLYSVLVIFGCFSRLVFTTNVCSMCPGEETKNKSNCNHSVSLDNVKREMNSLLLDIGSLIKNERRKLNIIDKSEGEANNFPFRLRKHKKLHRKIRFIHETYENLTVIYHVLEKVGEVFTYNKILLRRAGNLMCLMHQENDRFHCSKNKKPFRVTTSCKRNKIMSISKRSKENCSRSQYDELEGLSDLRHIQERLKNTLLFWNTCVKQNKGDGLSVKRKYRCRNKRGRKRKRKHRKKQSKSRKGRRQPRQSA